MRVLFLEIDTESTWSVASVGPGFLAAFLRAHGHEVAFCRVPLDMNHDALLASVRAIDPGLIGLSLTTRQWQRARAIVRRLRAELDVPIVAGGLHPTYSAEEVLASPGFDWVVLGEGELALLDLVAALERGATIAPDAIPNVQVRGGARAKLRKPFEPLDSMPFLARDMLDEQPGVVHVSTQRGCPFPCTYCAARQYEDLYAETGDYGRRRSQENVLAELDAIRAAGPLHYVVFLDDTFTIHRTWVEGFLALYAERCRAPFSVHARVETMTPALVRALADAGCRHVVYGVESGSERVRREVMQRPVTNDRIAQVVGWTKDAGILTTANYMLGLPSETRADLEATLALHERIAPDDFGYFVFYPYPGTALFRLCKERGYLPDDYLEREANHRETILRLPDLSAGDIAEFYERFTQARARGLLRRFGVVAGTDVADELRKTAVSG